MHSDGRLRIPTGGNPPSELALAERWDGTSWTIQPTSSVGAGYDSVLAGVSCSSASACTAVGDDYYNRGPQDALLAEQWNGTTWAIQPAPIPNGTSSSAFSAVSCPTATACMTVGVSATFRPARRAVERRRLDDRLHPWGRSPIWRVVPGG